MFYLCIYCYNHYLNIILALTIFFRAAQARDRIGTAASDLATATATPI